MNDDKICLICYDKCDKESYDIDYIVNCECKVNYHKKCIEEWLNIKNNSKSDVRLIYLLTSQTSEASPGGYHKKESRVFEGVRGLARV